MHRPPRRDPWLAVHRPVRRDARIACRLQRKQHLDGPRNGERGEGNANFQSRRRADRFRQVCVHAIGPARRRRSVCSRTTMSGAAPSKSLKSLKSGSCRPGRRMKGMVISKACVDCRMRNSKRWPTGPRRICRAGMMPICRRRRSSSTAGNSGPPDLVLESPRLHAERGRRRPVSQLRDSDRDRYARDGSKRSSCGRRIRA